MTDLYTIYSVLGIFLIIFVAWLMPALYNFLNTLSMYYHELFIEQKEINKLNYPDLYIPFKRRLKLLFSKENKK